MNILIAPDSFKECLNASDIAGIIKTVAQSSGHTAVAMPVADGGEGFVDALQYNAGGQKITVQAHDALMSPIISSYLLLKDGTAVIEAAETFGLAKIEPEKRNPLYTTTFGMGEQIAHALASGCQKFIIGLGGSATNDCGLGLMQALGFKLFTPDGNLLPRPATGKDMASIERIIPPEINATFTLAVDVSNPLLGDTGAAKIYAPQKGANPETVTLLENGADSFCTLLEKTTGKSLRFLPGAGAAGGAGMPFYAFFNPFSKSGIDIILDVAGFDEAIKQADLVITGEGRIDAQTAFGKAPIGVAQRSKNIPVIAVCGCTGSGFESVYQKGITAVYPITPPGMTFKEACQKAPELLEKTTRKIITDFT